MLAIGALSRRTGVKIPTIRYYEQVGLLAAADRTEGNQRRYSADELQRLAFIKHSRDLGLSINDIAALLRLGQRPEQSCTEIDRIASEHLMSVKSRITKLKRLEKELARIVSECKGGQVNECNVVRALSDHGLCQTEH